MRDCHAFVTRYTTRESQPPVPSRPYPARPALYIARGDFSIHLTLGDAARANAASEEVERPGSRVGWMGALRFIGGVR